MDRMGLDAPYFADVRIAKILLEKMVPKKRFSYILN